MPTMQRTKIVATIGPTSNDPQVLEQLFLSGVNICRLNFSFGSHEDHKITIENIRAISEKIGYPIGILQDLQGPKIRVGRLPEDFSINSNEKIFLSSSDQYEKQGVIPTTYDKLTNDVKEDQIILMADGAIRLKVEKIDYGEGLVQCKVLHGGLIRTGKGINLPNTKISMPSLTEKDRMDVLFGLENDVDFIALSFVRQRQDIIDLKALTLEANKNLPIFAKIEKPEAVENIHEIISEADGVMIARGDLAVEISLEKVPVVQKEILELANSKGKITITATQMLESMIENPAPTRAEVSDVANAIFDGSDAVMLSGETAYGKYPIHAVSIMKAIAEETEKNLLKKDEYKTKRLNVSQKDSVRDALCSSASFLSYQLEEKALAVFSTTGKTALILSKYRPNAIIYAVTVDKIIFRRMTIYNNVFPILLPSELSESLKKENFDSIDFIENYLMDNNLLNIGDRIILVMGENKEGIWSTNSLRVVDIAH